MTEQDTKNNRILVILGAGRTGTSLLAKILLSLGMTGAGHDIIPNETNPIGFFEDKRIIDCHEEIFSQIGAHNSLPFDENVFQTTGMGKFISSLEEIVSQEICATNTIWGFKDPRTSMFLTIWRRVFNRCNLLPCYVLTVRNPASSVISMHKQYNTQPELAELVWLLRTCEALYHTGGNCFIVHYEDWFTGKGPEIAGQLLAYTGLDRFWNKGKKVDDVLSSVVKPNLNRAVFNEYEVQNRHVLQLYKVLQNCRGDQFDRQALMEVVLDCRRAMHEFSGWSSLARKFYQQANQGKQKNTELNELLIRCKDLTDSNEQLRVKASVYKKEWLQCEKKQIPRLERKVFLLETSTSFQIGQHFINALTKPGKNTFLLPFYLLRTMLASRAIRK